MAIRHFIKKTHEKIRRWRGHVEDMKKEEAKAVVTAPEAEHVAVLKKMEITVSGATVAKIVSITMLLAVTAAFLYEIRDILVIFFVALLFAAALDPFVDSLERRKIPRSLGLIFIYLVVLFVLGVFISNLVPIVAKELGELAGRAQEFITHLVKGDILLPNYLERFRPYLKDFLEGIDVSKIGSYREVLLKAAQQLSDVAGNVVNAVLVVFNGFFNTIFVLVITFLMTVDETGIDKFILSLFPARHAHYIQHKSNIIKEKLGYWLRGQVVLCFVVGLLVYIGLLIIGLFTKPVEYAATIALVAGFTELIPYAGPFLAWIVALPIVANQSLMLVVWMTLVMYTVQFLENNFIVPLVMHKAVGISPIFIMFAMLVGFQFLGIIGMVLSVPVATGVAIFVKDYAEREK